MDDTFNIRIHYLDENHTITDINPKRYSHAKLVSDLDRLVLDNVVVEHTLFFTMSAEVEDTIELLNVEDDASVQMMFDRNMKKKEVELRVHTQDVEPLAVDNSCMKKRKKYVDIDLPFEVNLKNQPPVKRRFFRHRTCKPKRPKPPPVFPTSDDEVIECDSGDEISMLLLEDHPQPTQPTQSTQPTPDSPSKNAESAQINSPPHVSPPHQSPPHASPPQQSTPHASPPQQSTPYIPHSCQSTPLNPNVTESSVNLSEFENMFNNAMRTDIDSSKCTDENVANDTGKATDEVLVEDWEDSIDDILKVSYLPFVLLFA